MEQTPLTGIPETVDQAFETLKTFYAESLPAIKTMLEEEFTASAHFGTGMLIRNSWCLWWHEGHHYDTWPKEKPKLVQYFNDLGIVHPDDMSNIIMVYFYWKVHNQIE